MWFAAKHYSRWSCQMENKHFFKLPQKPRNLCCIFPHFCDISSTGRGQPVVSAVRWWRRSLSTLPTQRCLGFRWDVRLRWLGHSWPNERCAFLWPPGGCEKIWKEKAWEHVRTYERSMKRSCFYMYGHILILKGNGYLLLITLYMYVYVIQLLSIFMQFLETLLIRPGL